MSARKRVTTYTDKQVAFHKDKLANLTVGESGYYLICLSPAERWVLLTLLSFYDKFYNRWLGDWTRDEIDDLAGATMWRLTCPMACEEDFQLLIGHVAAISLTMTEIRDRLGPAEGDLNGRLQDISTDLEDIKTAVEAAFPSDIFDDLEPILNGVGVILGAAGVPLP